MGLHGLRLWVEGLALRVRVISREFNGFLAGSGGRFCGIIRTCWESDFKTCLSICHDYNNLEHSAGDTIFLDSLLLRLLLVLLQART